MNEKDLYQKIKNDAEHIDIPDSLKPEAIEALLLAQKEKNTETQKENTSEKRSAEHVLSFNEKSAKKKPLRSRFLRYGSMAAVFVLAAAVMWQSQRLEKHSESDMVQTQNLEDLSGADMAQTQNLEDRSGADMAQAQNLEDLSGVDTAQAPEADEPEFTESFTYADSAEDIYSTLYQTFYQENSVELYDSGNTSSMARGGSATAQPQMTMEMDLAAEENSADFDTAYTAPQTASGSDFSETNVQELGIDEGGIVKTDGRYIYILRQDLSFAIVDIRQKETVVLGVTTLDIGDNGYIHEMYLDGDTLHLIASETITALQNEEDVYYTSTARQVKLLTYDISDRSAPVLTGTVTQEGSFETSRKNGSYIYIFTSYSPDIRDNFDDSVIMPRINHTEVPAGSVYLPDSLTTSTYLVISSINAGSPDEITDSKVLVSGANHYYVSGENIYIANETYDSASTMTEITKFHYEDGKIIGAAAGSVKGYLNNSFSMNEYDGKLRVVSTYYGDEFNAVRNLAGEFTGESYEQNWEEHNALYVLDEKMQQIGAVEGLAEGETIRSARFFGDTGYFVTFEQTDPLFSVDLSDPADPQILGELKVSGFSSYLHFYGENLLLGIGYEADEETGVISGLKLSMFDISDPANVTEINRTVLPGITWCPAIEDYKSILVEPEKNMIGFYCDNRYLVFSYDEEKGFTNELVYDFYSDMLIGQAEYNTMRGLYIDDTFYLAGSTFLISFDMEDGFTKKEVIEIK